MTNLGISVKDSPQNTLVLVTRLDNGEPVAGATVTIRTLDNKRLLGGKTDATASQSRRTRMRLRAAGKSARRPARTATREEQQEEESMVRTPRQLKFIVTAEKDGDVAYVASNWNEGILRGSSTSNFDLGERTPLLRGTVFTDRGVYKLGEEVHFKAVLRSDTPQGMQLLPAGNRSRHHRQRQSSGRMSISGPSPPTSGAPRNGRFTCRRKAHSEPIDHRLGERPATRDRGEFLVAAYRRPDFRVDLALSASEPVAGNKLQGTVTARYLFGAPMASQPVRWTYSKNPLFDAPPAVTEHFPDLYTFVGSDWSEEKSWPSGTISKKEGTLNAKGELLLSFPPRRKQAFPTSTNWREKSRTSPGSASPTGRQSAFTQHPGTSV